MKDLICIGLLFLSVFICNGQNKLQESLDRYDYKTAISVIDSLAAEIGTDSTSIAEHRDLRGEYLIDELSDLLK